MNADQAKSLREPFPESSVGQLPRKTKDGRTIYLSYVGHAAVTDRLLQVDPDWTWEPAGESDDGLPLLDAKGGLWIRLTVAGVTRLGYGHGGTGFEPGDDIKKAIGDALRNAAMRFGVALDLWAKEDLKSDAESKYQGTATKSSGDEANSNSLRSHPKSTSPDGNGKEPGTSPIVGEAAAPAPADPSTKLTRDRVKALTDALGGQKAALDLARDNFGYGIGSLRDLTEDQATELLEIAVVGNPA